jgi:hypothetical protein
MRPEKAGEPFEGREEFQSLRTLAIVVGLFLIVACLQDIFEAVLLPRRIDREWRFMYFFYRLGWGIWSSVARRMRPSRSRESVIAIFGPLSMVLLFALWGLSLIIGFGLIQWAIPSHNAPLSRQFDLSADAFFTLGTETLGARSQLSLVLIFIEAGTGFGYIALMVGYLPVLYNHFAQRDARLVQLDARAGTPATAGTLLFRYATLGNSDDLGRWLADWEHWAADLVETQSAFPMLAFYRSQHEDQSWLATLAVVLDVTTLLLAFGPENTLLPASGAFLSARRVLEEICISLGVNTRPQKSPPPRVSHQDWSDVVEFLKLSSWNAMEARIDISSIEALVNSYESRLQALSDYLLLPLPRFSPSDEGRLPEAKIESRIELVERLTSAASSDSASRPAARESNLD